MTKFNFHFSSPQSFGQLQLGVSQELIDRLASKKDFVVTFDKIKESKTYDQLKGIHRIASLYALRLSEYQGKSISEDVAKENLKYQFGITRLASYNEAFGEAMKIRRQKTALREVMTLGQFNELIDRLQETYMVPKSFADCTKEEMTKLIQDIYEEFVQKRGWREMELLPAELRAMNERFDN